MILFFILAYVFLAVLLVNFVKNRTDIKLYKWLVVAFVILLPTWDVVLGTLVYPIACAFIPKTTIYETAETDGIYYEGINDYIFKLDRRGRQIADEELTLIGDLGDILVKGYSFAESKVTMESISYTENRKITPVTYRCIPLPKDESRPSFNRTSCSVVNNIKSRFLVKVTTIKAGIAEINIKKIYDRTSGKLTAEYKRVSLWSCFPFFEWMGWRWWSRSEGSLHCPSQDDRYYSFEYEVLKPKK